jgi:hypothetical protein
VERDNLKNHTKYGTIILKKNGSEDINWKQMAMVGTLLQAFQMTVINKTP